MKQGLLFIFFIWGLQATAQINSLVGDWKLYLKDKTSFEFLRLNADKTGIKCFGQTINGKDTLFLAHVTALQITDWKIEKRKLIIKSENTVSFKINPEYSFNLPDSDKLELEGEHLIFWLYPGILNREEFQRSVVYQRADKIPPGYGVTAATCIFRQRDLFTFTPIDSETQLAAYKGFEDLVPYLAGCKIGYEFVQTYHDPPYSLSIPVSIKGWSYGLGNKNFYISLATDDKDSSETSIVIYYDFDNESKDHYFSQIENGKEKKDIVTQNGIDIYKTINWQGKYSGKIFLANFISIAYYTRDANLQERLQKCITSFRYK
jgi:hypothetical protein